MHPPKYCLDQTYHACLRITVPGYSEVDNLPDNRLSLSCTVEVKAPTAQPARISRHDSCSGGANASKPLLYSNWASSWSSSSVRERRHGRLTRGSCFSKKPDLDDTGHSPGHCADTRQCQRRVDPGLYMKKAGIPGQGRFHNRSGVASVSLNDPA